MTRRVKACASAAFACLLPFLAPLGVALAQPQVPPPPPGGPDQSTGVTNILRATASGAVLVRVVWLPRARNGRRSGEVTMQRYDAQWRPSGRVVSIHRGPPVRAAVAIKGDTVFIAMINGGDAPFVKSAFIGARGAPRLIEIARPGAPAGIAPASVVAADDPRGFTVLWQEEARDAAGRGATSYMAHVGPDGAALGAAASVPIPWALGALAWNGNGYHLAAFYDGAARGQTRIALVTLTPGGGPEQHPWWAAPPDDPTDVQMAQSAAGMVVMYRGGADGSHVFSFVSSSIGQWGREPPAPPELGRVRAEQPLGMRLDAQGAAQVVTLPQRPSSG